MLLSCQVDRENAVNLDKKDARVSVGYNSNNWLILTYHKIVLNTDTTRAEVLIGVIELLDTIQVSVRGQVDCTWRILIL